MFNLDEISDNDLAMPEEKEEVGPFQIAEKTPIVQPSDITYSNFAQFKADINSF